MKTVHDTFNARYLSYQEVADSYVPSPYYDKLLTNNHSLLLGPRGCGKTTLLKMLTHRSLKGWNARQARSILRRLPFLSVYVPCDIFWRISLKQALAKHPDQGDVAALYSRCFVSMSFSVSLIRMLHQMMESELDRTVYLERSAEIVQQLTKVLRVDERIPLDMNALEQLITLRYRDVGNNHQRLLTRKSLDQDAYVDSLPAYYFDGFFDLARAFILVTRSVLTGTVLEEVVKKPWALCIDELELAPEWLRHELLQSMRSRDQDILLKVTGTPVWIQSDRASKETEVTRPMERNDYDIIRLWTHDKLSHGEWTEFARRLFERRVAGLHIGLDEARALLGTSDYDRAILAEMPESERVEANRKKEEYSAGSASWWLMKTMARRDESVRTRMVKRGVKPDNPIPTGPIQRASFHRKARPILVFRYFMGTKARILPLFYGEDYLYAMVDGNPRTLINAVDALFEPHRSFGNEVRDMGIIEQSRVFHELSRYHVDVAINHPEATTRRDGRQLSLQTVLQYLGDYVCEQIVAPQFQLDLVNVFEIDGDTPDYLIDLIEVGLMQGLFVHVDVKKNELVDGLVGTKFRLSYLLAPVMKFPSQKLKSIQLSKVISWRVIQHTLFE